MHHRRRLQTAGHNAETVRPPQVPGEHQLSLPRSERPPSRRRVNASSIPVPLEGGGVGLSWEFIRQGADVGLPIALRSLLQVINTLAVRHRDLSKPPRERSFGALCPGNLLFTRDGSALFPSDDQTVEQPIRYKAPECRAGLPPDQHSDIFALGVMLLETLSGIEVGDTEAVTIGESRATRDPKWAPHGTDKLFVVALRALEARPEARWNGVGDFAEALVAAASGRLAPKSSLAAIVGMALSRQGERATPVVQALTVPKAPAAPRFDSVLDVGEHTLSDSAGATVCRSPSDRVTAVQLTSEFAVQLDVEDPKFIDVPQIPEPAALPAAHPAVVGAPSPRRLGLDTTPLPSLIVLNPSLPTASAVSGARALGPVVTRPPTRRRRWPVLMALAAVVLGAFLAFWGFGDSDSDAGVAAAASGAENSLVGVVAPRAADATPPARTAPPSGTGVAAEKAATVAEGTAAAAAAQPEVGEQTPRAAPSQRQSAPVPSPAQATKPSAREPKKETVTRAKTPKRRYDPEGI